MSYNAAPADETDPGSTQIGPVPTGSAAVQQKSSPHHLSGDEDAPIAGS